MKVIELDNVGRKFIKKETGAKSLNHDYNQEFWALKNINIQVWEGQIIGIIGRNGSGKTTLLKIISSIIPPTEGTVKVDGKVSSLLTLGAGFQDELSGKENIFLNGSLLGLDRHQIRRRMRNIINFSELGDFINQPLGSYSDGMKMRLGFSIAINIDFDILAIDEVIMVGDISFQKKCFQKLMEFKRQNKTMIISTQSMDVIERLCDRVVLLEEGRACFFGPAKQSIERYLKLLNQKRFLERTPRTNLVLDTKRWATDMDKWGRTEGTKEVEILSVKTLNKWHRETHRFKTRSKMFVKVNFKVHNTIKDYHFGVALFREDGVYCYGPNTKSDGFNLDRLEKGEGFFILEYENLLLMPGIYYLAVAVWDKKETFAYDYHRCCYKIEINGNSYNNQLLNLDGKWKPYTLVEFFRNGSWEQSINLDSLEDKWEKKLDTDVVSIKKVKLLNKDGHPSREFFTNKYMEIKVKFEFSKKFFSPKLGFWIGIFRTDGIYCHGGTKRISEKDENISLIYPNLRLLPGEYRISLGVWDLNKHSFIYYQHGILPFKVVFIKKDHGTVYLPHKWRWKLPQRI